MAKNKQQVKFEADVSGFKSNIKEAEKSITSLNNQLKLNQSQLKGNSDDSNLLSQRIETLKQKYEEQTKVVENTKKAYEKAVEIFGENSKEAENLKNKLLQAETAQQNIKNEIDKTNQQLSLQTNELLKTSEAWQESGERLKDYGSKIENIGNKLSVVSGIIGGIAVASLKASIDFETAFAGVVKTVDGTEEQLEELREGILEMSTELPSSATEIAEVAESAGQLGIQTENILNFSKAMIDLGNSTNLTSQEAASELAKFANIMQMSQTDFDKLGSSIVDLGNNFATTEADIVSMAMRLAGAGKQVGFSEGEVLGLATALSSVGIEAEMGGSAISKAMVKMQNAVEQGGGKLNTVLNKTGMTLRDLELMAANDSMSFKQLSQSIGMTSTEVKQLITAGTNLEDFAEISGMSAEEFKKAWEEDAAGALSAFIQGLGNAEEKGESAITMLSEMGLTEVRLRDSLLRAANAGDLFNNAIETGTKAWDENIALTEEADKRYATTESQMKMLKNEVVKTAIEFGDELAPSLRQIVKDAKPLLQSISSAVKSFADLDEKTKKNIITIGAYIVALGPAIKVGGNIVKTIGTVKTGIGTLTGAIGVLKNGTEGASESSINLATSLSKFGTTGVVTLAATAGIALMVNAFYNATEETRKYKEETKKSLEATLDEIESIKKLRSTLDEGMQSDLNNIDRTVALWEELQKITDENGKIKDGYESRAKVITGELSEALETEITMTNNVIDKYKELQNEIDALILKKKAEIVLSVSEQKYSEAINNRTQITQELIDKENELTKAKEELTAAEEAYAEVEEYRYSTSMYLQQKEVTALENLNNKKAAVSNLEDQYDALDNTVKTYTQDIEDYEYNLKLYTEGTTDSINEMINSVGKTYTVNEETVELTLSRQIKAEQKYLQDAKTRNAEAIENSNETEKIKSQTTINEVNRRLQTLMDELTSQTSIVEENSEDIVNAWQQLATGSYSVYYDQVSQLPDELSKKIQEMTGVTIEKTPELVNETTNMASQVLAEFQNNEEYRKVAITNLQEYLNGLKDEELRELLKEAGTENVDEVINGIRAGNLAEDEGEKILKGLQTGLENTSWRDKLWSTARGIASTLSGLLTVKASVNGTTSELPGHKTGLDYVPYDNYVARLHKGERVLTADENKEYMTGNIQNKVSNRNIVVQFFPQTMSETELRRAEAYISKKWGMAL